MWLFQNDSALSIVQNLEDPSGKTLLVRSRVAGDIERAIPGANAFELAEADYRFRAIVTRDAFKAAVDAAIDRIDYGNFKASIASNDGVRHAAYLRVWTALAKAFGSYGSRGDLG